MTHQMKGFFTSLYEKVFSRCHTGTNLIVLAFFVPFIVTGWPVDTLEIRYFRRDAQTEDGFFLQAPVLLGRPLTNAILHSVEQTPVIDEYRIREGRVWAWREKIRSHNAGLPSLRPERGRFVHEPPWMVVEGTGESWENIHYRVGTGTLGKNVLCLPPFPCRELWREIPGARLVFSAGKSALGCR